MWDYDSRLLSELDFQEWFDELTDQEKDNYWSFLEAQQKADMAAWEEAWAVMNIDAVNGKKEKEAA